MVTIQPGKLSIIGVNALFLTFFASLIGGCAQLDYYAQAVRGEFSLLADARPIPVWLSDPSTSEKLKGQLRTVQEIRQFAVTQLRLPDNQSYRNYVQLQRKFVLWNVVATPALSLKPKQWCFPIAGCVSYRGYYNQQSAQQYGAQLRSEGYDVQVLGVPAYSTLGWFNDPVISTFIRYPDAELARIIFHELSHQLLYVKDDTDFNEAFATTVEEEGTEKWLEVHGNDDRRRAYQEFEERKTDFLALLLTHRQQLQDNYASGLSNREKLRKKALIFTALQDSYQTLKKQWGGFGGYDRWFAEPLSNAHLALVGTYYDLEPGFRALLAQQKNFQQFYIAVARLAKLPKKERHRQLFALAAGASPNLKAARPLTLHREVDTDFPRETYVAP
ncbi:aminopeptidase [Glaciimonas immobilis]|uniref:Putative aminopeptidase n=1 Tax=Glaciimonas immobilis TaxID=728004 RepID=A0A840RSC9_9BURK|nr:aminopeptidase [Glaciimonas immobilis]KAF3999628.1 aminopeptidase [Glaciimonas immobilis]MBB5200062.1 putative aminopeptidase [Glaciimonas immobilis]